MKKCYLTFFLSISFSVFIAAQAKPITAPTQQPTKILPAQQQKLSPATKATPAKQRPRETIKTNRAKRPPVVHKKRKRVSATTLYGNEWIYYNQKYYKIKVANTGLYRIDSLTLAKAGVPVNTITNRSYQIWYHGQLQYIYVNGDSSGYLKETKGNYIEFYGQYNDGTLDSSLYYNIRFLPSPYYSLFNDTSTYYLTWNPAGNNLRMKEISDTGWASYNAFPYIMTSKVVGWQAQTNGTLEPSSSVNLQNGAEYFPGAQYVDGLYTPNDPRFTQNVAWIPSSSYGLQVMGVTNPSVTFTPDIDVNNIYTGPGTPSAFIRTVVLGINTGICPFTVSTSARQLWNTDTNRGFGAFDLDTTFPATDMNPHPPTSPPFRITYYNNAITNNSSTIVPTYIYLNYPHTTNLAGDTTFSMSVPDNHTGGPKTFLEFTNFYTQGANDTVRMYDITNHRRFWGKPRMGGYWVLDSNSGGYKQCYLTHDSAVYKVKSLIPVGIGHNGQFTYFANEDSNAYIIISHPSLWTSAEGYARYRKSRGFDTVVADIYEIYDQFGYGVDYSPLGITNFCSYAIKNWKQPGNLFIMGKGIHTPLFRPDTAKWTRSQLYIPSYGYPSSDVLLSSDFDYSVFAPSIPTGRLAAQTNNDVYTYLSKVQTFESTPAALWMKNVAQFVGGDNANEENLFLSDVTQMMQTISDTLFGANVYLFQKSSPAPATLSLTDSVILRVDSGVSIMNFFGHASGSDWDESVDNPSQFNNSGKYPMMIAEACFSGDIFQPDGDAVSNVSEEWVLQPPGAIGFLASDYLGDPQTLESWATTLYDDISYRPFYRKSIASCIQNTIETWQSSADNFMWYTCLEMTLHGDPAIEINGMDSLPDYAVNQQSIYFNPANVTVLDSSFYVNIIVYNFGEALPNQRVYGVLTRTFPNGNAIPDTFSFSHIYYADTVSIKLSVNANNGTLLGTGLNYFSVNVDENPSLYKELTYTNNSISNIPLLISSEDITPVWPYDYAIIATDTATLKASTDDPFAPQRTYIFEIDTSHSFNSTLFRSDTVTNTGGVIMAHPQDEWSTVHFTGREKREPIKLVKGTKGKILNVSAPLNTQMNQNAINEKINTTQNNSLKTTTPEGQNTPVGLKKAPVQVSGATPTQAVSNGLKLMPEIEKTKHGNMNPVHETFRDTTVYYWRVRRDTSDTVHYPWVLTSFEDINKRYGWGQSNFFQYDSDEISNNVYNFINFNKSLRNWSFNENGHTLECFDYGMPKTDLNTTDLYATEFKIDNYVQAYAGCQTSEGFYVAVIDKTTLVPWSTLNYDFGQANNKAGYPSLCSDYPDNKFVFWDAYPAQTDSLAKMLSSPIIPNGDYILVWTWINGYYKTPGLTNAGKVDTALLQLGCTQIVSHTIPGRDSVPMIFFVQKGNPLGAQQLFGTSDTSALYDSVNLRGNGTYGCITTPYIGPAAKYDSLSWHQHSYDHGPLTDSTRLNVIGIQTNGTPKTLESNITPAAANMYISSINATLFPYIQMQMYCKDSTHHTPAQMNWWRVFYQPVPEIAMNPNIYTYYHADTLQYGDKLNFQTTVQNISDWPIASTQLLTWTSDAHNNIHYYNPGTMLKPLNPGDTAKVSFVLPDSVTSANTLKTIWFEVNPENYPTTREEEYHFNDYAEKTFYSYGDKINPVLDVTFNGIHILNNDIVSPQPQILITFMDENKFLALNNPNDFKVSLRNVTTNGPVQQINYGSQLSFTPAVLPYNKCSLVFTPTLADGTYELYVQGSDISGNPSALNSYSIEFQVINKSMITQVLNYPNPFTTSTRFVFILTGEQIPTTFKIQIMTVTGKIVREINEDEVGPIHIGRNITQYAWDGTDQYGSKLGNGVYLYRVVTAINGQGISEFQQGYDGANVDQYFTQGWGKMYLMR